MIVAAALLAVGCMLAWWESAQAGTINESDYRLDADRRIIYGRTPAAVNALCFQRIGGFSEGHNRFAWIDACYTSSDGVMVLLDNVTRTRDAKPGEWDYDHELKHELEGNWHN